MRCRACDSKTKGRAITDHRLKVDVDIEMRQVSRAHKCLACQRKEKSVEVWSGELCELRRDAYLWRRSVAGGKA